MSDQLQRADRLLADDRLNEASAIYAQLVHDDPNCGDAWIGLGRIALQLKQPEKAVDLLIQGLRVNPESVPCYTELGKAMTETGNLQGALLAFEGGLRLAPKDLALLLGIADAYIRKGLLADAERHLRFAIECYPEHPVPLNNLGDVLKRQRQYQPALEAFRRAIDLNPSIVQLHLNMAFTHLELRQFTEALHAAQKAVELDPQSVDGWFAMGNAHCFLHQTGASMAAFERVLALNPQYPEALINLGNAYSDQGRISEALDCYRRANEVDSTCLPAVENILSTLHYSPECGLAEIYRAHVAWDEKFARQFREQWQPFDNDRSPERPLRIGLYSNNLGNHPVGYFVRAAFEALDRSQFSLVVYSGRVTDDAECDHFKETASEWCEVAALSDAELATKIRQDHIDILIDLAGRSAGGRPFLLARKPAPLLINWIGYTGTLGLSSVDYILTDRHHIPEGAEEYYVEEVLRLDDGHICFEGPATAPDVSPLPAASRGYVTFGSFNNPGKVNSEVVDVWAEILRHVPESRLVLKYRNFADSSTRGHFEELFAQRGIEAGRLTFEGVTPYSEMLRRYHDIDIALDPFPFTGGMTTCLALWMGCPVITWPRDTFASRQSLSYLLTIGLPELVAAGRTEYVGKAVGLASDLGALANLRRRIRPTMSASPFCDRVRFVRNLERVLRGVWRKWCKDSEA